jgi:CTP:molybdopterin cytidylyltransferase MocA
VKVDVILPAGGRIHGDFAAEAGTAVKALIELRDTSILTNTVQALRSTGRVNRMVAIGPAEIAPHAESHVDAVLPESDSGPENIYRGLDWLRSQPDSADRALIMTTDLPFVTPESVSSFLARCPEAAEIALPLFSKQEFENRFPGSLNSYVRLRDGEWTIGGAFLLSQSALERNRAHIQRIHKARKSPFAMAQMLGVSFIARYLTRTLKVAHLESHCARITGCAACAVRGCDPALAFDIDESADYRYARRYDPNNSLYAGVR